EKVSQGAPVHKGHRRSSVRTSAPGSGRIEEVPRPLAKKRLWGILSPAFQDLRPPSRGTNGQTPHQRRCRWCGVLSRKATHNTRYEVSTRSKGRNDPVL